MSNVTGKLVYKYQVAMSNGRHTILADEPENVNGTDLAPGPYELLCASLAACKAMTCRMYAERKQWDLQGMNITVAHRKVKASETPEAASEMGFVDIFDAEMSFEGDLDATQRDRLLEISTRCPVHRTLLNETIIHSSML